MMLRLNNEKQTKLWEKYEQVSWGCWDWVKIKF